MTAPGIDPALLLAWLAARSVARGLPAPVPDRGGFRVDTGMPDEVRRWVFPRVMPDIARLAREITEPRHCIKLCDSNAVLAALLPPGWQVEPVTWFMRAVTPPSVRPLPAGYRLDLDRDGDATTVRIWSGAGDLAASGHGGETAQAFVYDRIVTSPDHRRLGLGRVVMTTLHGARRRTDTPELLVATAEGRALYETLGWESLSPYATASMAET